MSGCLFDPNKNILGRVSKKGIFYQTMQVDTA
jgi:hypothetical protein